MCVTVKGGGRAGGTVLLKQWPPMKCHFTSVFPSLQLSFYCNTLKHFFFEVNMSSTCWPSINRVPASAACTSGTPLSASAASFSVEAAESRSVGRRGPKAAAVTFLPSLCEKSLVTSHTVPACVLRSVRWSPADLRPTHVWTRRVWQLRPPGGTAASYAREQLRREFFFF